jgi:alkylation response protein AidB-like acyl-CoA dehydrogenase
MLKGFSICSIRQPGASALQVFTAKASEAYQRICIDGITTHRAIGYTMYHDIGLYYRRVKAAEFAAGDIDLH